MKAFLVVTLLMVSYLNANARVEQIPPASNAGYDCNFPGMSEIEVKLYPDKLHSKKFSYRYQIVGDVNPEELVLIYLPGGPGGTSINDFSDPAVKDLYLRRGIPESIPWIMFDPRTAGCNRGEEETFPDDSLTSEYLAHDVLSVIESLKLKKYVLYGHSYGSQWATFIAAMAPYRHLPSPHAIFMSGVLGLGKADGSFSIPSQKILEWELLKAQLSPEANEILREERPLGIEPGIWSRFISTALYEGVTLIKGEMRNFYLDLLKTLDSEDPEARKALTDELTKEFKPRPGVSEFSDRLFLEVDCHEYSPADGYTFFRNGSLIFDEENDPCEGEAFDRIYDSAKMKITSHIYYLSGTNDPAAPYEGARYHFENQHSSRRNFITVQGGGHVNIGQILRDCKTEIWEAIFNLTDLQSVLTQCEADVILEIK